MKITERQKFVLKLSFKEAQKLRQEIARAGVALSNYGGWLHPPAYVEPQRVLSELDEMLAAYGVGYPEDGE